MQQVNRLVTKNEQEWHGGESTSVPSLLGGWGGTPYNIIYGKTPTERGTFFMLQVYERLGLLLLLCLTERFFSWCSGFPVSPEPNLSKFQFDPKHTDSFKRVHNNFFYLFIF